MVQTYPSMSLKTFANIIKLILHNMENTVNSYKMVKYSYSLFVRDLTVFGTRWCGLCFAKQSTMDIGCHIKNWLVAK